MDQPQKTVETNTSRPAISILRCQTAGEQLERSAVLKFPLTWATLQSLSVGFFWRGWANSPSHSASSLSKFHVILSPGIPGRGLRDTRAAGATLPRSFDSLPLHPFSFHLRWFPPVRRLNLAKFQPRRSVQSYFRVLSCPNRDWPGVFVFICGF